MTKAIKICQSYTPQQMVATILEYSQLEHPEPIVFKGVVDDWPAVKQAKHSANRFCDYLLQFDAKVPVYAYECDAQYKGRFFYDATQTSKNFEQKKTHINEIINHLNCLDSEQKKTLYMGSTTLDYCLPKFRSDNDLPMIEQQPLVSLWLGSESEVAAHYDVPHNIACVVAGKRAFTLFAPEQIANLYPGPIDFTPAGQIVSMVDFNNPDHARFPKYRHALERAYYAELEPGDAIYIPSMWWHHVKSTANINALVNYWWRTTNEHFGLATDALTHAVLSISKLPKAQRRAWRDIFDHYVFSEQNHEHINDSALGMLGEIDEVQARKIRWQLIHKLNQS